MPELNERIEWEARRVAAAFGVIDFQECSKMYENLTVFEGMGDGWDLEVCLDAEGLIDLCIGDHGDELSFHFPNQFPKTIARVYGSIGKFGELMARGLYRLGFEGEAVLSQLPQLTSHERLELRLSMPREFWPQAWREERTGE